MSKLILFYATTEDILAVTRRAEAQSPLKYVRFGAVTKLPPTSFNSAASIPGIGTASRPSAVACESFLVCDPQTVIKLRQLKTLHGEDLNRSMFSIGDKEIAVSRPGLSEAVGQDRFAIDQMLNPETIKFTPAGIWKEDILLHGQIGSAFESPSSKELMNRFGAVLASEFTKVKAFYVGRNAFDMLKKGKRLTISEQSPREFDLRA